MLRLRRKLQLMLSVIAAVASCVAAPAFAQMPPAGQAQMPNAQMMSGIPMPMADVPDGTVSVRLVRGEISNALTGQQVELSVDGQSRAARTDDSGRAQFTGIAAGASLKASATVDGERLESQSFAMPEKGGVRLLLAASAAGAPGQPPAPITAGEVSFGGDSRIIVEFDDATMSVYYLLDVVNNGNGPVNPKKAIEFDLPADAASATALEGSSPQVQVKGRHVTIAGPFKPGRTSAQIAFNLTSETGERTIEQRFPASLDMLSIAIEKVGALEVKSPQLAQQRDVPSNGKVYVAAGGPGLPAGQPVTLNLSGLPHHPGWPRTVALVLAVAILGGGVWAGLRRPQSAIDARRAELERRREALFADLLRLEQAQRAETIDAGTFEDRRGELLAMLERIYGELDSGAPTARAV